MVDCLDQMLQWILDFNVTEACIRSDNAFRTKEWIEMLNLVNCYPRFGLPGNSTSNSEIERRFRTVGERFRIYNLNTKTDSDLAISLCFVTAEINALPIRDTHICPYELVYGFSPKLFLLEHLPIATCNNLQAFASNQYNRLLELSKSIEACYDKQADAVNLDNRKLSRLFAVGQKVRIRTYQPTGRTKFNRQPFSTDVYTIKQTRPATRSYLLELKRENRQSLEILVHHRRVKLVQNRPERLIQKNSETIEPRTQGNESIPSVIDNLVPNVSTTEPITMTRTGRKIQKPSRYNE